jgi:uncharacterized protein
MSKDAPTKDLLRYDLMVQDALKGVVRRVLIDAARDGLPGDHHFYISFRTDFPGVRLSQRMREKYPDEMTVVLQHQFWDLGITEHTFEVGLSFSGIPERLLIPFDSIVGFFDPSVQFGLKFELNADSAPVEGAMSEGASITPVKPAKSSGKARLRSVGQDEPEVPAALLPPKSEPVANPPKPVPATTAPEVASESAKPAKSGGKSVKSRDEAPPPSPDDDKPDAGAQVVSLDAFRKKT